MTDPTVSEHRLRNMLVNLCRSRPMSESEILAEVRGGCLHEWDQGEVQDALSALLNSNKIRWVAFRGYQTGGRP